MTPVECVVEDEAWSAAGDLEALAAEAIAAAEAELSLSGGKGLCILFTGDGAIAELNAAHRGKSGPTNVLSFPAHDSAEGWLGDIALASGVCLKEAGERGIAPADHVRHLLIHGFLHLQGYDHQADSEAEEMEAIERRALARLGIADPYAVGGRMNE
ncbi:MULTISPECIES: rRNA maturation RNase YbeY [Hyphobacterium]|uniref:Endoribonuclease YbeY n=1 Tax=Hyphobacterium vulgare TaxID=1736751 RepID=A0ABV6ZX62_9PROT